MDYAFKAHQKTYFCNIIKLLNICKTSRNNIWVHQVNPDEFKIVLAEKCFSFGHSFIAFEFYILQFISVSIKWNFTACKSHYG